MRTLSYPRPDASGGLQNASSWQLRKSNELDDGRNIRFNESIGAYWRRNGYIPEGAQYTTTVNRPPLGAETVNFTTGAKRFVAVDNDAGTAGLVRVQDSSTGTWTTLITDIPVNSDVYFTAYRDEVYISGYQKSTGIPFAPYNIDKILNVSKTRNLLNVPPPYYFATYAGKLYACNVLLPSTSTRYPERFYQSSAPTGAFTFVQGQQTNVPVAQTLVNNIPTMTSNTVPQGVAYGSTIVSTTFDYYKAFDGNTDSYWQASATTGDIAYDFGSGVTPTIAYYSVTGGSSIDLTRAPKTWILQGSNNNSTWTDIDTQTNVPTFTTAEQRYYNTTNTTAYRYYRLHITANQGNSSNLDVVEFGLYTSLSGVKPFQIQVDSVRYAKPGMSLDIYKAGTSTLLYTINVYGVDKPNNIIQFLPLSWNISSVNTTTDVITSGSATGLTTGTPINFSATTALPTPLATNTVYYYIAVTTTTFKVASSLANATIGVAIDLTTAGSGTNSVNLSYIVNNNDEIYLSGKYGKLSTLWNTDYPTEDIADWSAAPSNVDSSNAITGVKESNNRLMVFTENSSSKFDGNTTIPFNSTVGCINQRTLKNIDDDWLIWMSSRGRVYARNEAAGQQQMISRGIANKLFSKIPRSQFKQYASAGISDNEYIIYVGSFKGEPTRAIYDFGSNTWTVDAMHHASLMYINDIPLSGDDAGFIKPFFLSDDGYMYQDDIGDFDGTSDKVIRLQADYGKVNYGSENYKKFLGCWIYSINAQGLKIYATIDNERDPKVVGQISNRSGTMIEYPTRGEMQLNEGTVISLSVAGAIPGARQVIEQVIDYYSFSETKVGYGETT